MGWALSAQIVHSQSEQVISTGSTRTLVWRGGIMMTANSPNFGGWSDLHVSPDGKNLTSISDEGAWLTATIEYDGEANLAGLSNARIGQLHGLDADVDVVDGGEITETTGDVLDLE